MEEPCLRVKTCRRGVVRDPNLGTYRRQCVEGFRLRAVRVRRREQPNATSFVAMAPQSWQERTNATPPNERHQDVHADGRWNLGCQLVPDRRLAGGVRQDGRVEERSERQVQRGERPVWPREADAVEHSWRARHLIVQNTARRPKPVQEGDELGNEVRAIVGTALLGLRLDQPGDNCGEMPGEPVWCLRVPKVSQECPGVAIRVAKDCTQRMSNELAVNAGLQRFTPHPSIMTGHLPDPVRPVDRRVQVDAERVDDRSAPTSAQSSRARAPGRRRPDGRRTTRRRRRRRATPSPRGWRRGCA